MRFAIVGAGATGGFLGARLARAGEEVILIARGAQLAAIRSRGLRVLEAAEEYVVQPESTDDLAAAGGADVIFLTVKAYSLPGIAPSLAASLGPETALVTVQNGIPWWYFAVHPGKLRGTRLRSVDPDGVLAASFEPRRIIGGVVWPGTELVAPGVVRHIEGNRFSIGEPDGSRSDRCQAIAAALARAGLKCPISRRIHHDIWFKVLGSVAMNPLSALTRATLAQIAADPATRAVARAAMEEADQVARALDVRLEITVDQRLEGAARVGEHKTSMLQDVEAGRPLEVEAIAGAVVELGDLVGLEIPHLRTLYACTRLLDLEVRRAALQA